MSSPVAGLPIAADVFVDDGHTSDAAEWNAKIIDPIRNGIAYLDGDGWQYPVFQNGWDNYGGDYQDCRYRKVAGIVYLQALLTGGAVGTVIFTLPAGYRPTANLFFGTAAQDAATGVIAVLPTGDVKVYGIYGGGAHTWISLDDICFFADGE